MAWEIVKKAEVADLANQSQDLLQDHWYDWVEGILKEETGYEYYSGTTAISDEAHDGDGTDLLRVKYPPIASVSSLSIDGLAVSSDRYKVYSNYIRMVADIDDTVPAYFPVGVQNVTISYSSGFSSAPAGVKLAFANAVIVILQFQQRGASVMQPSYTVPSRREPEANPIIPSLYLATVIRKIIKTGVSRSQLRFN